MGDTRCVIANMSRHILGDIVEKLLSNSVDIEVVERVDHISQVNPILAEHSIDLLVLGMTSNELPEVCIGFLNRTPNVAIVGLFEDGRRMAMFIDNVSTNVLLRVMKAISPSYTANIPKEH